MIAVVDYGRGNLFSIAQSLRHLGADYELVQNATGFRHASHVILPGVGAFGDAMNSLARSGLVESLVAYARSGRPLLGICLGMQLLAAESEEFGSHRGLNLIPGFVRRLPDGEGPKANRIPNVGWRALHVAASSPLAADFNGRMMYFVHSYAPEPLDRNHVLGTITVNNREVTAMIRCANVVGCQFHPEKSGPDGLAFIRRFLETTM